MDRQNTRQVTEMRGAYRLVASSCLRTWMARDTNRYIRWKNRQCSGLVCRRVSRSLDAEWQNRRSSLTRLYDRSWHISDMRNGQLVARILTASAPGRPRWRLYPHPTGKYFSSQSSNTCRTRVLVSANMK